MNEDEYSPGDFEEGWKKDYFSDSTGDEMERSLQNSWAVELLVADYEQAGEDGRMRDGLLHNSYYVGLVLFGLILNASLNLADSGRFVLLATVTLIGSILYVLLFAWSLSSKAGREQLRSHDTGRVRSAIRAL